MHWRNMPDLRGDEGSLPSGVSSWTTASSTTLQLVDVAAGGAGSCETKQGNHSCSSLAGKAIIQLRKLLRVCHQHARVPDDDADDVLLSHQAQLHNAARHFCGRHRQHAGLLDGHPHDGLQHEGRHRLVGHQEPPQSQQPLLHQRRHAVHVVFPPAGPRRRTIDHGAAVLVAAPLPPEPPDKKLIHPHIRVHPTQPVVRPLRISLCTPRRGAADRKQPPSGDLPASQLPRLASRERTRDLRAAAAWLQPRCWECRQPAR
mmetsp:Transcript_8849/g.22438  ORF Transcript_8849/g.22438 Transcript_8849/m.22438 type:complete len:259 (+) Transcript_8849:261-1037(+)